VLDQARAHGWLPPSWRERIESVHAQRCAQVDALAVRLADLHQGFASLPRLAEDHAESVPTPISWQD
jgi:MoxR-like ATPase